LHNDIQFVADQIIGRGFFENIGATRREGAEFALDATGDIWSLSLDYSFTTASFQSPLILNSPDNPLADANSQIAVTPGNHLPGIPAHLGKALLETHVTSDFAVTVALRAASGTFLRGDEANLNPKIPGYAVVDFGARYRISDRLTVFGLVSNIFDTRYATFGAFSPTSDVPLAEAPGAINPRSLSPAPPRWFSAGVTANF
jgi:outer membrane receptor protein involved in Fe transport